MIVNNQKENPMFQGARLVFGDATSLAGVPYEYTGWRDETMSWKETAYLGTSLMVSPILDVKGSDVAKFFSKICVNNFENFKVGRIRHGIICNEKGQIMTDGVIMKLEENLYRTYWLHPVLSFLVEKFKTEFDISAEDQSGKEYFFQVAGPLSLEILEKTFERDLHDIEFGCHKVVALHGKNVRILRLGMTGNLAYELHGDIADTTDVYDCVWEAGKDKGLRKLGQLSYSVMNHTEGGFPNIAMHYPMPWYESEELGYEGFSEFLNTHPGYGYVNENRCLVGSIGDELQKRFLSPVDVGWSKKIRFNHEFIGRKALEEQAANPAKTVVTLEWNADDVMEIYGSQFRGTDVEPYEYIEDCPNESNYFTPLGMFQYRADKILANGKEIGISSGRTASQYFHRMISLGFIEPEYAAIGTELILIWGTPGSPQKEVRVKVERFPYLNLSRNNGTK